MSGSSPHGTAWFVTLKYQSAIVWPRGMLVLIKKSPGVQLGESQLAVPKLFTTVSVPDTLGRVRPATA